MYGPGPQAHAPYHYQKNVLSVSGDAMALAQEAHWFYQSQGGNRALGHFRPLTSYGARKSTGRFWIGRTMKGGMRSGESCQWSVFSCQS